MRASPGQPKYAPIPRKALKNHEEASVFVGMVSVRPVGGLLNLTETIPTNNPYAPMLHPFLMPFLVLVHTLAAPTSEGKHISFVLELIISWESVPASPLPQKALCNFVGTLATTI